jgi:hypothetical protein
LLIHFVQSENPVTAVDQPELEKADEHHYGLYQAYQSQLAHIQPSHEQKRTQKAYCTDINGYEYIQRMAIDYLTGFQG